MVFTDLFFLYFFLPVCLICYFITRNATVRNLVLVVFSLIFYAWGEPLWVLILPVAALSDYLSGKVIGKGGISAKLAFAWSLLFDTGLMVLFKYSGAITDAVYSFTGTELPLPKLSLPIGLSFYVLRSVSYNADCLRGKIKPEKSYLRYLMYVSLFPQVAAGPVVKYADIREETGARKITIKDLSEGFSQLIRGLAKKLLIANSLGHAVTALFGDFGGDDIALGALTVLGGWYGLLLTGLWLYFELSGYSDMAVGLGRIFGFHFKDNFNYPFACVSVSDFWERWHISLGDFFRDYVRDMKIFGKKRTYLGIILMWLLMGLWHGASLNFMIWGLYVCLFILLETAIGEKRMKKMPAFAGHIYSKLMMLLGVGLFWFNSLPKLEKFFSALAGLNGNTFTDSRTTGIILGNIFVFIAAAVLSLPVIPALKEKAFRKAGSAYIYQAAGVICNAVLLLAGSLMLIYSSSDPVFYFNF